MVTLKCPSHPRYTAKISPKASCQICISLYEIAIRAAQNRITVGK